MPNDLCPYCGALRNAEHISDLCKAKDLVQELVNAHLAWMQERDSEQWEKARPMAEALVKNVDVPLNARELIQELIDAYEAWRKKKNYIQWEDVRPKAEAFLKPMTLKEHYQKQEVK